MREKVAIGVVWHGAELMFQKKTLSRPGGPVERYDFPGGKIAPEETSLDATVRALTVGLGFPFSRESFGKLRTLRNSQHIGFFREALLPYGAKLNPEVSKHHDSLFFWMRDQIDEALEDNTIGPLATAYIERHL